MRRAHKPFPSPGSLLRVPAATIVLALASTGCSALHRHLFGGSPAGRSGTITVSPPTGTSGTRFSLTAGGFRPGEKMTFEIDVPRHPRFVGPSHVVGPDGRALGAYSPQAGDPPGTYTVKAAGDRGTHAATTLVVTAGPAPPG